LLLSTYIKWVNVFPEIKPQLLNIFERYRHVLDADLQQRACEFYALASRPNDDELLQQICEEMPPFPPRVSALLGRLNRKHGDTGDKRTWIHGGKELNNERVAAKRQASGTGPPDSAPQTNSQDILNSLSGLNLSSSSDQPSPSNTHQEASSTFPSAIPLAVGADIDHWFDNLTYNNDGILFEDVQVQIGIKSRYQSHMGQVAVYIGNKITTPLTSFTTTVHVDDPKALSVTFAKIPSSTIPSRTQTQQLLHVECKQMFKTPPTLTVSFLAGSHQTIAVRLPIVITKFIAHVKLGPTDFFERWKLIGGPPREVQKVFPVTLTSAGKLDLAKHRQVVVGHQLNILEDIDPNPNNLVAAGVLHMSTEGKVGCLLRLEPNQEAKVCSLSVLILFV
jgi:AP-2 complex subunit alpha